ncbi:porin family protein [Undibacterium pigrum]|uniref:Outer membrane protein with beta-barrel domain n=1 Tax=Undibacterium pigrum TaxID=401470 RepID=A0A318JTV4_9BURK|nr:porin family protein [Undibacterium pigrum]PXX47830.1 outer membrane protein with beta-barrel domain [Undibacterium pigrum]
MPTKKIIALALAISSLLMVTTANAQFYAGATIGQARWNMDCAATSRCKTSDTSFNVLSGYNFNANWGLEGSYYDLGTVKATIYGMDAEMKASGIDLAGTYRAQLGNNWGLFTKLGLAYSKGEATATFNNVRGTSNKNSAQALVGVGATYTFTPNFAARAEISSRKVDFVGGDGNITNFNVGVQALF